MTVWLAVGTETCTVFVPGWAAVTVAAILAAPAAARRILTQYRRESDRFPGAGGAEAERRSSSDGDDDRGS